MTVIDSRDLLTMILLVVFAGPMSVAGERTNSRTFNAGTTLQKTAGDLPGSGPSAQEEALRRAIRSSPRDTVALVRLGTFLAAENRFREAVEVLEKAVKLQPDDWTARRSLAASYWQLGEMEKASKDLEMVLKAKPDDTFAMLLLGLVSEDLGNHQRAAKLLGDVLPLVRQRPEAIMALARARYQTGQLQKARDALQMLAGSPAGPAAVFSGGRLAAEFKDYETAEAMFLSIETTYPDAGMLNYNLALAQFSAARYQPCEETLMASIANGHATADTYALLGWTYGKLNRLEEMLKAFERAINLDPSNQAYFVDLGEALVEKKNYPTALEVAKEAVKRFPSSSQAHAFKGSVELKMFLLTDALKSYTEGVSLDLSNPRAALGLALTQWNMDRNDQAAKSFEEGVRRFPNDAFFLLKYALFLLNEPGERDAQKDARIRSLLGKSEELDPANPETHFQLGSMALKESRYDEALRELQTAERLDPEVAKVHLVLARVYRRAGREEDAVKETQLHRKLKEKEEQDVDATAAIGTRHP